MHLTMVNPMNKLSVDFEQLNFPECSPTYHYGPPLSAGALPSFFYFSLSGPQSLQLDPFNQPVMFLAGPQYRIFSLSLPGHAPGADPRYAMKYWHDALVREENIIEEFVIECGKSLDTLIQRGYIDLSKVSVGGLSRGAFAATHWAARDSRIKNIVGYSPLVRVDTLAEFPELAPFPLAQELSLMHLVSNLVDKNVSFYIGNCDKRVYTKFSFEFIQALAEAAQASGHRSPEVRLSVFPSIGHKGHGTPPEIFKAGIEWLRKEKKPL